MQANNFETLLMMARTPPPEAQKTQWPYFSSLATNRKTKDTFFSSTFKVWESKVSLVFSFMAQGPRYWHFPTWRYHVLYFISFKNREENPRKNKPLDIYVWKMLINYFCFLKSFAPLNTIILLNIITREHDWFRIQDLKTKQCVGLFRNL